jgi:hypothetical protein
MVQGPGRSLRFRTLALLFGVAVGTILANHPAVADEILKLEAGQAAIIFMVDGKGRSGEMLVRDAKQPAPVWASVLGPASVRQFTVRPGSYAVLLSPTQKTIAVAAAAGRATVLSLAGTSPDGAYLLNEQNEVAPADLEQTAVPTFITERRLPAAAYAPTSLDARGAGLTFVLRADF